jgi:hypothetical protein
VTIEPGIAGLIMATEVLTDWTRYRKCPICGAGTGHACFSMYARIHGGQTEGGPQLLTVAHGSRQTRRGR